MLAKIAGQGADFERGLGDTSTTPTWTHLRECVAPYQRRLYAPPAGGRQIYSREHRARMARLGQAVALD
jgi:hypothetical protein